MNTGQSPQRELAIARLKVIGGGDQTPHARLRALLERRHPDVQPIYDPPNRW